MAVVVESRLSSFITRDGRHLAVQDWLPARGRAVRALVLIVHGLGEHAGRYERLARTLNAWGYAVRSFDLHGHGESGGLRGSLPSDDCLLEDLAEMLDESRAHMAPDLPLVLLGHSLGGLLAARLVSLQLRPVDALVLSSPALDPGLNPVQKMLLAVLPGLLPELRMGNGLQPRYLSHDPQVVAAYRADRLVHDRISARLARFIAQAGVATLAQAPQWRVPTLLLYAGQDHLVSPQGSRCFAALAPAGVVHSQCFDALYHEIFNEAQAQPVLDALQAWLDQRS